LKTCILNPITFTCGITLFLFPFIVINSTGPTDLSFRANIYIEANRTGPHTKRSDGKSRYGIWPSDLTPLAPLKKRLSGGGGIREMHKGHILQSWASCHYATSASV